MIVRNDFFLKKYVTSEGDVSHNVFTLVYYQQLSISRYQLFCVITNSNSVLSCLCLQSCIGFNIFQLSFITLFLTIATAECQSTREVQRN